MASSTTGPKKLETWQTWPRKPEEVMAEDAVKVSAIGFWKIAIAVFVGNLLTAVVVGIFYAITHS